MANVIFLPVFSLVFGKWEKEESFFETVRKNLQNY